MGTSLPKEWCCASRRMGGKRRCCCWILAVCHNDASVKRIGTEEGSKEDVESHIKDNMQIECMKK